jgi:amidohydrolase
MVELMIPPVITSIDGEILEEARKIREDLHKNPELAFQERRTAGMVAKYLHALGLEVVSEGVAGTGVVGLLRGERPGRTVALRAELDALPIREKTGLPWASISEGEMHACGHDGHMAVLLAAARVLAGRREALQGIVKFIFQPGEERGGGARKMVEAGVLDNPKVAGIFALHARPQIRAGEIELDLVPGAASNPFEIRIIGKGCHAAYPHMGIDPIPIGCLIVNSLQQVVSRQVPPFKRAVVSVGAFHAGSRGNVIPEEAVLRGTIRTRDPQVQKKVVESVGRITQEIAGAFGAKVDVRIESGTPRVANAPRLMELVRQVGIDALGAGKVKDAEEATMGAEDFGCYLEEQGGVPGCLFRLGVETDESVHSARFDFGHQALEPGILMMSNLAIRYLSGG